MKHILSIPLLPVEQYVPIAKLAEEVGFEGVQMADHIVMPNTITSVYPNRGPSWPPEQVAPFDVDAPWLDCWVLAGALAAHTTTLRFYSGIYILPLRNAFITAKTVATAAALSGGRIVLGVGVGWMKEEFDLAGQDFATRGARMNEDIEVLRRLWSGETEFHGTFYDFDPLQMRPLPPSPVPIYTGGEAPRALQRTARLADGYLAFPHRTKTYQALIDTLQELREEAGRADEPFEFIAMPTEKTIDDFGELEAMGVHGSVVRPWPESENDGSLITKQQAIVAYAETVIEAAA